METKNTSLAVPISIVIAGIIIAGAVYFSGSNTNTKNAANSLGANQQNTTIEVGDIPLNPISSKDYMRGNPNAKVVVVEFSDTECPYCKAFHVTMKDLANKLGADGTLAWVYRNFPLKEIHPKAVKEAEALLCAGKIGGTNGFWNYTDRLYGITPSNNRLEESQLPAIAKDVNLDVTAFNTCLSSGEMAATVEVDYQDGVNAGGTGTPFSIFITQKEFDRDAVEAFLVESMLAYKFPSELFKISSDNKKVSVSGAMPGIFIEKLVSILAK